MKFSIIVPIYNIEKYLDQCVMSLVTQDFDDYEIILVDDGSRDRCPEICDYYAKQYRNVRVIHKENGGLVSARNAGVAIASGEYIGYVDGDDWVEPNLLSKVSANLMCEDIDVINFNFYNFIDGTDTPELTGQFHGLYKTEQLKNIVFPALICNLQTSFFKFGVIPAVWCKFYKAELLKRNLCSNMKITFGEDVACAYPCLLQSNKILFIDDCLYHYRRNRSSMTKAYSAQMFENCNELLNYLDEKLVTKEYHIPEQKMEYKNFVIFKCILNEARGIGSPRIKAKRLLRGLNKNEWIEYLREIDISSYPFAYKVFFTLAKKRYYTLLMAMCTILLRIHG